MPVAAHGHVTGEVTSDEITTGAQPVTNYYSRLSPESIGWESMKSTMVIAISSGFSSGMA
jgi:hypothetical protein